MKRKQKAIILITIATLVTLIGLWFTKKKDEKCYSAEQWRLYSKYSSKEDKDKLESLGANTPERYRAASSNEALEYTELLEHISKPLLSAKKARKELNKAWHLERNKKYDEAIARYKELAYITTGDEQYGAIKRYLKVISKAVKVTEIPRINLRDILDKEAKTDLEWILLAGYEHGPGRRKCYQEILENYNSPFYAYAQLQLIWTLRKSNNKPDREEAKQMRIKELIEFVDSYPDSPFIEEAKIRLINITTPRDSRKEAYEQLIMESDDKTIQASCLLHDYFQQVYYSKEELPVEIINKYTPLIRLREFYGSYGEGEFIPQNFDLEQTCEYLDKLVAEAREEIRHQRNEQP